MSVKDSVLIIDFDPRSLRASRKLLESKGIPCVCIGSAAELDERLQGARPALVVLDPMLPGRDGFRVCRTLKEGATGRAVSVIVASRIFKGQRYRNLAREAGADLYLERPRDDDRLLAEINRLLSDIASRQPSATQDAGASPKGAPPVATFSSTPSGPLLEGLTDDEIDSALFRALGDDAGLTGAEVTGAGITGAESPGSLVAGSVGGVANGTRAAPAGEREDGGFSLMPDAPAAGDRPDIAAVAPEDDVLRPMAPTAAPVQSSVAPSPRAGAAAAAVAARPSAEELPAPAPAPAEVTPHAEDLWASLEKLELQVAQELGPARVKSGGAGPMTGVGPPAKKRPAKDPGTAARTLDSPMAFDPSEAEEKLAAVEAALVASDASGESAEIAPPPSPESSARSPEAPPEPRSVSAGTGSHRVPLAGTPAPDAPSGPIADTETIESVVDNVIAFVAPPSRDTGPNEPGHDEIPPSSMPSEEFLVVEESSAGEEEEPPSPEESPDDIPESLRGMDAGTADLLSSLEELESSLPEDFGETAGTGVTGWDQTGLTGHADPQVEPSVPHAPPPASEEEASLEGLVDQLVSQASEPVAVEASSIPAEDSRQFEARSATGVSVEEPPSRRLAGTLLAALAVVIVLLGVAGGFYLTRMSPVESAPAIVREMPVAPANQTVPPSPEIPAASTAQAEVSRRPIPEQIPDDQPAVGGAPVAEKGPAPHPSQTLASERPGPGKKSQVVGTTPSPPLAEPATASTRPPSAKAGTAASHGESANPTAPANTSPPQESPGPTKSKPVPAAATGSIDMRPRGVRDDPEGDGRPQPATLLEAPPEPPAAPNPLEPPVPLVRLGELDYPLRLLEAPQPELTPEAVERGAKGRVFVNVLVGPNGEVKDARVMIEPGYGLGQAALRAVKSWRFSPPRHGAERVRVWKTEVVEFRAP